MLVLVGGGDGQGSFGIENDNIGIAAGGDGALAREEAEEFGGHSSNEVYKMVNIE